MRLTCVDDIIKSNISTFLVCVDADKIASDDENGAVMVRKFEASSCSFKSIIKPDCDHHPLYSIFWYKIIKKHKKYLYILKI